MTATSYYVAADDIENYVPFDVGKIKYIRRDDHVTAGIWVVTPEEAPDVVEVPFPKHETIHVLEGRVEIAIVDGPTYVLGPGDSGSFVEGTPARWRILEPLRQLFVYS
jgi:uncharacterized cupin superfamily protein